MDLPWDEAEIMEEIEDSEETWSEFSDYCVSLAAANLQYIMKTRAKFLIEHCDPDIVDKIAKKHM